METNAIPRSLMVSHGLPLVPIGYFCKAWLRFYYLGVFIISCWVKGATTFRTHPAGYVAVRRGTINRELHALRTSKLSILWACSRRLTTVWRRELWCSDVPAVQLNRLHIDVVRCELSVSSQSQGRTFAPRTRWRYDLNRFRDLMLTRDHVDALSHIPRDQGIFHLDVFPSFFPFANDYLLAMISS